MTLQIRKAERASKPLKLALKGASGSGKTYSAILLAKGLCDETKRVILIDSEDNGADMYDAFDFDVIPIGSKATGAIYQEAMELALNADAGLVIIDSLSHDWEAVINKEAELPPENMKSWAIAKTVTGHANFLDYLWRYPLDVICTIRCDESFEVAKDKKGRITKKKIGLKPVQQPRLEYNFDIVFDIESDSHVARTNEFGKNRTPLFQGETFLISQDIGRKIKDWKYGGSKWIEPLRDSTRKVISKYAIACNRTETWRELIDLSPEIKLVDISEEMGQRLLELLKRENSQQDKSKTKEQVNALHE